MATPARIGYDNRVISATATSEADGFEADSVVNSLTYERWKPTSSSSQIIVDLGSTQSDLTYVGVGAHTLGSAGCNIVVGYSLTGSSWTSIDNITPTTDRAIMVTTGSTFPPARYIRLLITGGIPTVGSIFVGAYLEMYRPFYAGFTPGVLSRQTTVKPNKSVNGQWLGRSIVRQGLSADFQWRHTPLDWYITNVEPLSVHAQTEPFFIQWNPDDYPTDVLYCWTSDDIKPKTMGIRDLVEFGFAVEAIE
jgi:hypothetical protein